MALSHRSRARRPALAVVLAALALLAPCAAEAEENRYSLHLELGPLLTFLQPARSNELQYATPGLHIGFAFEYSLHDRIGLEVLYAPDTLYRLVGGGAALEQHVAVGVRLRPWFRRGYLLPRNPDVEIDVERVLSDVWIDVHVGFAGGQIDSVALDAAVGTRVPIHWPFQLGVFARYQHLFSVTSGVSGSLGQLAVGVEASLGFLPVARAPDRDRDGVADVDDRCPETPAGTRVNAVGCPVARNSGAPRCTDSDLDGVCEGSDECPDTPINTPVDRFGCPLEAEPDPSTAPPGGEPVR